jgi:hypothetical protein
MSPRRYLRELEVRSKPLWRFFEQLARRPELTRAISISEIMLGTSPNGFLAFNTVESTLDLGLCL